MGSKLSSRGFYGTGDYYIGIRHIWGSNLRRTWDIPTTYSNFCKTFLGTILSVLLTGSNGAQGNMLLSRSPWEVSPFGSL